MFVNVPPMPPTYNLSHRTSAFPNLILPFAGGRTKHNTEPFIYTHEQAARCQRQDHLYIQSRKAGKPVCGLWNGRPPAFYTAQRVTDAYQKECAKWKEIYREKATPKSETIHGKIQRYREKADRQNANQPYRSRDKGARWIAPCLQFLSAIK